MRVKKFIYTEYKVPTYRYYHYSFWAREIGGGADGRKTKMAKVLLDRGIGIKSLVSI
jgi:hypothetical protein